MPSWHRLEIVGETFAEAPRRKHALPIDRQCPETRSSAVYLLGRHGLRSHTAIPASPPPPPLIPRGWAHVIKSFRSFAVKSFFRTYLRYYEKVPPTNNDIPGRITYRALISSQLITGRKVGVAGEFASMCSMGVAASRVLIISLANIAKGARRACTTFAKKYIYVTKRRHDIHRRSLTTELVIKLRR